MLVATFFHQLFEKSEVEILHLQKIVWDQPYINKEKEKRECGHRGFLVQKKLALSVRNLFIGPHKW